MTNSPDVIPAEVFAQPSTNGKGDMVLTVRADRDVIGDTDKSTTLEGFAAWLVADGFTITKEEKNRIELCRPGKSDGQSCNIKMFDGVPVLWNFSTAAGMTTKDGLSPSKYLCWKVKGSFDKASLNAWANEIRAAERAANGETPIPGSDDPKPPRFQWLTARELADRDCRREWFIRGVLTKNEPCGIIGLSKTLKTSIALDAAISMATGSPFLGNETFTIPRKIIVGFMSAESGEGTLQEGGERICMAKGFRFRDLADKLHLCFDVPFLKNPADVVAIADDMAERGAEFVLIDPFYLTLGDVDARNLFEVGGVLSNLNTRLFRRGISCGILHHANRKSAPGRNEAGQPLELQDIAYSGLEQWVRQTFLLSRRSRYEQDGNHKLFFKWGGSAGHGGLQELDIYEGMIDEHFRGRVWNVSMTPWAEAKEMAEDEKDEKATEKKRMKAESDKREVLDAIDWLATRKRPTTKTAIGTRVPSFNPQRVSMAIEGLIQDDAVVTTTVPVEAGNGGKTKREVFIRKPVPVTVPTLNFGDEGTTRQPDEMAGLSDSQAVLGTQGQNNLTKPLLEREVVGLSVRSDVPNGKPHRRKAKAKSSGCTSKSKAGAA